MVLQRSPDRWQRQETPFVVVIFITVYGCSVSVSVTSPLGADVWSRDRSLASQENPGSVRDPAAKSKVQST